MSGLPAQFRRVVELLKSNRYREARELMQGAAAIAPDAPGELVELAQRLLYFNLAGSLRNVATLLLAQPLPPSTVPNSGEQARTLESSSARTCMSLPRLRYLIMWFGLPLNGNACVCNVPSLHTHANQ